MVEGNGLEIRRTLTGTVGSNPTSSAATRLGFNPGGLFISRSNADCEPTRVTYPRLTPTASDRTLPR